MKNPLKRRFKGFYLILSSKLLDLERKTSHEPAFAGISRELLFTPPNPLEGGILGSLVRAIITENTKQKRQLSSCLSLFWSGKRDSNSRPQPWQGCALPTELFPHYFRFASANIRQKKLLCKKITKKNKKSCFCRGKQGIIIDYYISIWKVVVVEKSMCSLRKVYQKIKERLMFCTNLSSGADSISRVLF